MKQWGQAAIAAFLAIGILSCGSESKQNPKPAAEDSFSVKPSVVAGDLGVNQFDISIKRSALDKEFLLQGSFIVQLMLPMSNNMKSRVVTFKERGRQLVMLESNEGQQISSDLPQNTVLATFPILASDENLITFDFNSGMSQMFVGYDWWASDFDGASFFPDLVALDAKTSYIESASLTPQGLVIRQISQVEGQFKASVETKYYLSAYTRNEAFVPMKSPGFDRVGYFEVQPQLINAKDTVYVSKFDVTKTIRYGISANTPENYREAVRDGILYWNKAFGRDVIAVYDAPEGVTAPNENLNIVQWVDWDDAGFAYADAQMDPLTGEILHSQVYLTSAFAAVGESHAADWLARLGAQAGTKRVIPKQRGREKVGAMKGIGLRGLQQSHLCFRDETSRMESAIARARARGTNESQILKMSQDFVREVVAHEVGHTLGLRHNFAGSTQSNFSMAERRNLYAGYIMNGKTPSDLRTTSSVMDYNLFEEASMAGDLIAKGSEAFAYDQKAIEVLYSDRKISASDIPLFCTDSHAYGYSDCLLFDSGSSNLAFNRMTMEEASDSFAQLLSSAIVSWKKNPADASFAVEDLYIDPWIIAYIVNEGRFNQIFALDLAVLPYLSVVRRYSSINHWNEMEVYLEMLRYLGQDISSHGGVDALWPEVTPRFAEFTLASVMRNLERSQAFTDAELAKLRKNLGLNLADAEVPLAQDDLALASEAEIRAMGVTGVAGLSQRKIGKYVLSRMLPELKWEKFSLKRKNGRAKTVDIKLTEFAFSGKVRQSVAMLADATQKANLRKVLEAEVKAAFGGLTADEIDSSSLPEAAKKWLDDTALVIAFLK